jgi:biopolymer transport protein ExbD
MKIARRSMKVEVPSVAMGDIAFNLLIFFVILAKAQDDSHLKWQPTVTEKPEPAGSPRASVLVDVGNKVYLNGQQVSIGQLTPAIEKLLGSAPAGQRTVLLKVHKDAQALLFEPIMEAVSQAGGEILHVLEKKAPS